MRRAVVLLSLIVIAAVLVPVLSLPASAQILCDPADHCWTAKKERKVIDNPDKAWFTPGAITSGSVASTTEGESCWHLNIPNYWKEWWFGTRTIVTQTVNVHWCWSGDKLTSMNVLQSYSIASFSFWHFTDQGTEAATGDPTGGTWAYRRVFQHYDECNAVILPLCVNMKMWTSVTVHPGTAGGAWTVDRGVTA